jgi:hypothetical protein
MYGFARPYYVKALEEAQIIFSFLSFKLGPSYSSPNIKKEKKIHTLELIHKVNPCLGVHLDLHLLSHPQFF